MLGGMRGKPASAPVFIMTRCNDNLIESSNGRIGIDRSNPIYPF